MNNKRGMLGNIIGATICVFIALTLVGTISQEVDNAINCNITLNVSEYETPLGSTDSFGGGGSGHFGGYDGTVKKSWSSDLVFYKTNDSVINPNCNNLSKSTITVLELIPVFFVLLIITIAFFIISKSFRDAGMI
jgi:hypothetical protein